MTFRVNLQWKVFVTLSPEQCMAAQAPSLLFNPKGGRSFSRSIGGDFRMEHPPIVLAPTDILHQALRGTREDLGLRGNRFPYEFTWTRAGVNSRVNIALHLHDDVLCATVRLEPFEVASLQSVSELQDLSRDPPLWQAIRKLLAITVTGDREAEKLARGPQVLPAVQIECLDQEPAELRSDLTSLLTKHSEVNDAIVKDVFEKNQPHQVDTRTILLLDKQGVVAYVPAGVHGSIAAGNRQRFEHSTAMLQLACVLRLQLRGGRSVAPDMQAAILDSGPAIPASISGRFAWSLLVLEFSLKVWLSRVPSADESVATASTPRTGEGASRTLPRASCRILFVTVTPVESQELHAALKTLIPEAPKVKKVDGFTYQYFGKFGDFEIYHQISGMGSGGIEGSQESIRRSIGALQPQLVFMVGIAFGVSQDKQPVGTVLVARQIQMYELQRINKDASIVDRGDRLTAPPLPMNWCSHAEVAWGNRTPTVKKGLVLSGEKLVDNKDFRDQLKKLYPEAVGGEMEGAGLCVACQLARVDWLLMKGVCDWADGHKSEEKDKNQAVAAKAAAEFAVHLLRANSETGE